MNGAHDIAMAAAAELPKQPPEWVHLFPMGVTTGRDGRGPYRLRDFAHAEQVVAATRDHLGSTEAVVDYEHQTDLAAKTGGGAAPAAGWITEFQARANGIWARIAWTAKARAGIAAREFRYLSPTFAFAKATGDLFRIERAALTNTPNFNLQTALASTGAAMNTLADKIKALLGLPADADEAAVLVSLNEVLKGGKPGDADTATAAVLASVEAYIPREAYDRLSTAFASMKAVTVSATVTGKVEEAIRSGKVTPAMREWAVALASTNPDSFDQFVRMTPVILAPGGGGHGFQPLPGAGAAGSGRLSATEIAVCSALGHTPEEFAKANGATNR